MALPPILHTARFGAQLENGETMKSRFGALPAVLSAVAILILAAPPVGAASAYQDELRLAPDGFQTRTALTAGGLGGLAPAACDDAAFKTLGGGWQNGNYSWSFNGSATPRYLNKGAVLGVLMESFSNITNAHNNCSLADHVSATHTYLGTTATAPKCGHRDGKNVVGFHKLQFGVLAVTCYWMKNGHMVEADVQMNPRAEWTLSLHGCFEQVMLEATMTHEAGHVFGLDHVSERRHGRLTMSPFLDGPCQNAESTLGKGDIRGLESLY